MLSRLVPATVLVAFVPLALGLGACSPGQNAASHALKTPELPTDKQTKCKVAKSQSEPLIVEWPDAARGRLESVSRRGLVAVRYEGCELAVLSRCTVKSASGGYGYSPITRKQSKVTIKDADELYASMPVGAVKLETKLQSAGQLDVQMTIVGRYESPTTKVYREDLEGDCADATHVIAALTVGSFTFSAGADAELGGGASVVGAGGGGKSSAKRETIQHDGDEAACSRASLSDKAPPEGCGALLQIEVMPLAKNAKASIAPAPSPSASIRRPPPEPAPAREPRLEPTPPTCMAGTHLDHGACVVDHDPPATSPSYGADAAQSREVPNPWRGTLAYLAIGGGVTAAGLGYYALSAAKEGTESCDPVTRTCAEGSAAKRSTATTMAILADVALGVTALSVIGLFLVPAKTKVGIAPTNGGAVAGASGSF